MQASSNVRRHLGWHVRLPAKCASDQRKYIILFFHSDLNRSRSTVFNPFKTFPLCTFGLMAGWGAPLSCPITPTAGDNRRNTFNISASSSGISQVGAVLMVLMHMWACCLRTPDGFQESEFFMWDTKASRVCWGNRSLAVADEGWCLISRKSISKSWIIRLNSRRMSIFLSFKLFKYFSRFKYLCSISFCFPFLLLELPSTMILSGTRYCFPFHPTKLIPS